MRPRDPGPVTLRRALLAQWAHAWPACFPTACRRPPTPAELDRAARRWAALDRARGVRILPPA